MKRERTSDRAFTLVELLVVIAIIAILIAILLPVITQVRRRALVLVCPIAYVGEDGAIYLTDPKGGHSLQVSPPDNKTGVQHAVWAPVSWSPCGRRLAFNSYGIMNPRHSSWFLEPTGQMWRYNTQMFSGWIDSERFLGYDPGSPERSVYSIYDGNLPTHRAVGSVNFAGADASYYSLSPTPAGADFPYVAGVLRKDGTSEIAWVRKNLQVGRTIWRSTDLPDADYLFPKIDPFNECAAWGMVRTSVRRLRDDPSMRPLEIIGRFCDWTDDGNVLTIDYNRLAIYTKNGKLVRRLSPPVPPKGDMMAAYRKYGHH